MAFSDPPCFELKSGTLDVLLFVLKTPDLARLGTALDKRLSANPAFFDGEAVAIDLRRLPDAAAVPLDDLTRMLTARRMRPLGLVARDAQSTVTATLPRLALAEGLASQAAPAQDAPAAPLPSRDAPSAQSSAQPAPTLVIDKPLRSGQRVMAPGDLVVTAPVNHDAELIAAGNIHVYGPLRGRAIAGALGNEAARIWCTCLEAGLVSIAGVYRTAEQPWPEALRQRPACLRLEGGRLVAEALPLS